MEHATLAVFQHYLFTPDHTRIFADEFAQELDRLTRHAERRDDALSERLAVATSEIANLGANMLAGVISETLTKLLVEREAEKQRLEAQIQLQPNLETISLPSPADLTAIFQEGPKPDGDAERGQDPRRSRRDPVESHRERNDLPVRGRFSRGGGGCAG